MPDDAKGAAQAFFMEFLETLKASETTNKQLLEVQLAAVHVEQQKLSSQQVLSAQLNGIAQRLDILDQRMAQLSRLLVEDSQPVRLPGGYMPPRAPIGPGGAYVPGPGGSYPPPY